MPGYEITPDVEQFLAERPNLVLATIRRDGGPQLSPVWYVWRDGAFFISTITSTAKWANLTRDQRCSGIVDDPEGRYVYVSGVAELDDGDVLDTTQEIVRRYKTEEEFGPYMESIYREGHRAIIRLVPDCVVTRDFR
ncbi:MAG: PPOX class F420-dependent oxidoreductase [Dehalococcoidia bacterium]|jgi:PPOX class probable F420-dependent enzyme|nr:PPOX class F420-dependent oxidoreductase [Dehalococcoidia bacterium]